MGSEPEIAVVIATREVVQALRIPECQINHLLASGAAPDRVFVAILDEDDAWQLGGVHTAAEFVAGARMEEWSWDFLNAMRCGGLHGDRRE